MADETPVANPDENPQQGEFNFPNPDDFPSYDETDSEDGQAEIDEDTENYSSVGVNDAQEGCGCVR